MRLFFLLTVSLVLLSVAAVTGTQAQDAPTGRPGFQLEDRTYLYYFETDDALLTGDTRIKGYSFGTAKGEKVTILVYGLDNLVTPRLTLFDASGSKVQDGSAPFNQSIALIQFTARDAALYHFDVERTDDNTDHDRDRGGLARVMLFEGDPINQDITILDDINPLLPGRGFMVAGASPTTRPPDGLRMQVAVLDVSRFATKPEIFAARGTFKAEPTIAERFHAADAFAWVNSDGDEIYTVSVRARPEDRTPATARIDYRALNLNTFFYFDYYLTIGSGSVPVQLKRGDDCQSQPNRVECIKASGSPTGRTAPAPVAQLPQTTPPAADNSASSTPALVTAPAGPPPPPPLTDCTGGGTTGIIYIGTAANNVVGGTPCDDYLNGQGGNDVMSGGPGNDTLIGDTGSDTLYGGDDQDQLFGGDGSDTLFGENGSDMLNGGTGNDVLDGGAGIDLISYDAAGGGVTVDLSDACFAGFTGCASGADGSDHIVNVENIVGSNFDDTLTGDDNANNIQGRDGNDTINGGNGNDELYGEEGNDTLDGGDGDDLMSGGNGNDALNPGTGTNTLLGNAGNDTFTFDQAQTGTTRVYGGSLAAGDSDTYLFLDGVSGNFQIQDFFGGSNDVIDFSALTTSGVNFNLGSANFFQIVTSFLNIYLVDDDIGGLIGTDQADVLGGSNVWTPNDVIDARAGNDIVFGSRGSDVLTGGAGNDTLDYSNNQAGAVVVDLLAGATTSKGSGGTDTLSGFENLTGSGFDDTLTGDNTANIIDGRDGADVITANGGNDTIIASNGNDTIDGGAGSDHYDASGLTSGAFINLQAGTAGFTGANQTLSSIEVVTGTAFADTVYAATTTTSVSTGAGNDFILSTDGTHTYDGGSDTYSGSSTSLDGDGDTLYYFYQDITTFTLQGAVVVNLNGSAGTVTGSGVNDTFTGIENITGTNGNDVFNIADAVGPAVSAPPTATDPYTGLRGLGGSDSYIFNAAASGYVYLANDTTDILVRSANFAGTFSTASFGVWQVAIPGQLYIFLEQAISAACDGTTPLNLPYTTGDDDGTVMRDTNCRTDDFFDGLAGNDTINYSASAVPTTVNLVVTLTGLSTSTMTVDDGPANVTGFDTIANTENILLGAGDDILYVQTIGLSGHTLDFGGGTNSISFIGYAPGITVNLDTGGSGLTLVANQLTNVETSLAADSITGNALNNTFVAQADSDADFFDAGGGTADALRYATTTDFLTYTPIATALTVTLGAVDTVSDGIGLDTLSNFEQLYTGSGADTFSLNQAGGTYTRLDAGGGNDTFQASTAFSGTWNQLEGGAGTDTLSFSTDASLFFMTVNGGTVSTNQLFGPTTTFNTTNVEQVVGGSSVNLITLTNTTGLTEVNGAGGNDSFSFSGYTPTAATVLDADNGVLDGTADSIDFSGLTGSVTVNVTAGNTAQLVGGNLLRDFENFTGTTLNDTFNVTFDNTVTHSFNGSAGTDTIDYSTSGLALVVAVNATTTVDNTVAGGFVDSVSGFENFTGSGQNDTFNITDASAFSGATGLAGGAGDDTFNLTALDAGANRYDGGAGTGDAIHYTVATPLTLNVNAAGTTVTVQDTAAALGIDTLVNFETIVSGSAGDTWNMAGTPNATYNAAGGIDTADFSSMATGVTVNLTGASPTVTGAGGTTTLVNFENIISTNQNDVWTAATSAGRVLDARGGTNDTLQYTTALNATVTGANVTAGGAADTLTNFEALSLNNSANNVTLNTYTGTLTTLNTLDNNDTLTINGSTGTLVNLNSGNQDDTWTVNALDTTANLFDGGAGTGDSLTYNVANNLAVTVNSAANTTVAATGFATDTLNNFETILSGSGNDTWTVNALFNATFDAQGGSNTIGYADATGDLTLDLTGVNPTVTGTGGTNTLINFQNITSNNGNDTWILAASGGHVLDGLGGTNTATYTTAGTASFTGATVTAGGSASADTLTNIQTIALSTGVDTVTVNGYTGGITTLNTRDGNDIVNITGSTGGLVNLNSGLNNDTWTVSALDTTANTFDGDAGVDSLTYSVATDLTVTVVSATGMTVDDGTTVDTLNNFETVLSGTGNDTWTVNALQTATYNAQGGTDTITYAAAAGNLTLDLTGANPTVSDGTNTTTLLNFESIVSNNGNDTWILADTASRSLDGLGGSNTVRYVGSAGNNFAITLNGGTTTVTDGAGPDSLSNIQTLQMDTTTATTDSLVINAGSTVVTTVDLGLGADTVDINSTVGTTTTIGSGGGNDTWTVDVVSGGATFDGGAGTGDTISYAGATDDLTIDLTTTGAWTVTALAGTDALNNFEAFTASGSGDDTWTVNAPSGQTYNPGTGNDTLIYATTTGAVTLAGLTFGTDNVTGFETVTLNNNVNAVTLTATTSLGTLNLLGGSDTLTVNGGVAAPATIDLGDGNDTVTFNGFDNVASTINGGNNTDSYAYTGATGLTLTWVSAAQATITNGTTTDTLTNFENFTTGSGADTVNWRDDGVVNSLNGGTGNDTLDYTGHAGALTFTLAATDTVAGAATDTIASFEVLRGGDGSDTFTITDSTGYTTLNGGAGDDSFNVAAGGMVAATATVSGGAGNDTFNLLPDNISNPYDGGADSDTASYAGYSGGTALTVVLNAAVVTVSGGGGSGTDTLTSIETLTTSSAVDTVTVNNPSTVSTLNTGAGNDSVTVGATGAGTLTAVSTGTGDDSVTVGAADTVATTFDGGTNTAAGDSYSVTPGNGAATVVLSGASDTVTVGGVTDTFNNFEAGTITTGSGSDSFTININDPNTYVLAAGAGVNNFIFIGDITTAAGGQVTLGGTGTETLDFSGLTGGGVTVNISTVGSFQTIVTNFQVNLTGTIENVVGTNQADTIVGNASDNTLTGNGGNDTIHGGAGNDTLTGDAGDDTLYGGAGTDTVSGGADNDQVYGGSLCGAAISPAGTTDAGNDVVDGGAGNDSVFGGNNNNTTAGATAVTCNDTGSDTVTDPTGGDIDHLYGGNNNGASGTGTDTNTDTVNATDGDATVDTVVGDNLSATTTTNSETSVVGDASDTTTTGNGP